MCVSVCRACVVLYPVGLTLISHTHSSTVTEAGGSGRTESELEGSEYLFFLCLKQTSRERLTDGVKSLRDAHKALCTLQIKHLIKAC